MKIAVIDYTGRVGNFITKFEDLQQIKITSNNAPIRINKQAANSSQLQLINKKR